MKDLLGRIGDLKILYKSIETGNKIDIFQAIIDSIPTNIHYFSKLIWFDLIVLICCQRLVLRFELFRFQRDVYFEKI